MRIAIPVTEKNIEAEISKTFGRSNYFLIYDDSNAEVRYIDNVQNLNAAQGAGIQSAQNLVANDINVLLSDHLGPKALRVLKASAIKVYTTQSTNIKDTLLSFNEGKLNELLEADVEGHWM